MEEVIFLNGKFLSKEEARISVLTPGFLYGWGLFETMRSYNGKIIYFGRHLKRIKHASKLIGLEFNYPISKLKKIISQAIKLSGFKDAYVRLTLCKADPSMVRPCSPSTLSKVEAPITLRVDTECNRSADSGVDTLIVAKKYRPYSKAMYRRGFSAAVSPFRQNESSFFARLKTTNYLLYQLSYLRARDRRFDESIILNNRGCISEASRSNIFFIKDKRLFTPSLECGCLRGITRTVIFDLAKKYSIAFNEGKFWPDDLYNSDEAFLTNSLMGVMPLVSIENRLIGKGRAGRLTRFFIGKYDRFLL